MPHAGDLIGYAVVLVVATLIISFGAYILASVQAQQTPASAAYNITGQGLTGLTTFGTFLPIVAIVLVAGVLIGILIAVFAGIGGGAGKSV